MIGFLRGVLVDKRPPGLVLDVQGVGYEIDAPMSTFFVLPSIGESVTLLTHLAIREDAHQLFGFATEAERGLFRSLLKVNGIGARLALGILSGLSVADFRRCIHGGDVAALVRLPGIGKKTAERLVVEMRDRVPGESDALLTSSGLPVHVEAPDQEAISALVALGYRPPEAERMVKSVSGDGKSAEDLLRQALQSVARAKG